MNHGVERMLSDSLTDSDILIAWGSRPDGLIAWSSPAWRCFTGISVEQQKKHRWQTCLHPEDESGFDNEGNPHSKASRFRLLHHDGTFRSVLGYIRSTQDSTGYITGYHAACFETETASEQKAAAAPPKEEADQTHRLIEADLPINFDHQAIRDLFDNDKQSLRELAELFDMTCKESVDFLATAFTAPNQQQLFNTAHRLKGAIANINAPQVLKFSQQLETAIQENQISAAEKISQQVVRYVNQLRDMVKQEFTS